MSVKVMLLAEGKECNFIYQARNALDGYGVIIPKVPSLSYSFYERQCKENDCKYIVTCSDSILTSVLRALGKSTTAGCNQWAGAKLTLNGITYIITKPFSHLVTTMVGRFLFQRHVNKHLQGTNYKIPPMEWANISGSAQDDNVAELLANMDRGILCSVDIETKRKPMSELAISRLSKPVGVAAMMPISNSGKTLHYCAPTISMIGYYVVWKEGDKLCGKGYVLSMNTMADVHLMRKLNMHPIRKCMQNGGYDSTYFIRFGAPLYNYLYDTFHFMHCWYAEVKRDLASLTAFFLPDYEYWKDEMEDDTELYNAKDVYNTAWIMVLMLLEAPQWVKNNYLIEFRKVFVNICMGLEGLKSDEIERERIRKEYSDLRDTAKKRLATIVSAGYNPNSPPQTLALMNGLARYSTKTQFKTSGKTDMKKFAEESSVNSIIKELITDVRKYNKAISTYIDTRLFSGRLLYEINSGGTDTGRGSSKASNLWVGTQIQNQDGKLRSMYVADDGYLLFSVDNSQSESRCTAYISEDLQLIDTVETAKDFHCRNTSLFFGISEDEVVKTVMVTMVVEGVEVETPKLDAKGKPMKDKSLRDVGKRVNHGANYNMGEWVLIETMGRKDVLKAGKLLGLPANTTVYRIAGYLLGSFDRAYPLVRGKYYDEVIQEIAMTGMLVTPNGWTRYCIGRPSRQPSDKMMLNKYVAHKPQCLSVMMIDEALFDFWHEYQIVRNQVRLKAQVHDEIVAQSKPEYLEENMQALAKLMERPIQVRGRTMKIPNDGGAYGHRWSELKD